MLLMPTMFWIVLGVLWVVLLVLSIAIGHAAKHGDKRSN